ncbi:MAG: carboxypeptidase-like regulatory domain-containing protein, partial [Melioribacteraceae bacterium]
MKLTNTYLLNITIVLISLSLGMFGQSTKKIFGFVTDKTTSLPLVGANIIIDGTSVGTSSDEFGYFQFDNLFAGSYSIVTSFVGYKKRTSPITIYNDQPTEISIQLKQSENKLDEILIAGLRNNDLKNIELYTSNDIARSNYQSVAEILEQTPGLEIQSTGGVGSTKKASIRGSETNQVLVLLDGIPLNNQLGGGADLS